MLGFLMFFSNFGVARVASQKFVSTNIDISFMDYIRYNLLNRKKNKFLLFRFSFFFGPDRSILKKWILPHISWTWHQANFMLPMSAGTDMTTMQVPRRNKERLVKVSPQLYEQHRLDYVIYRLTPLPPTSMITCFDDLMDFELVRY